MRRVGIVILGVILVLGFGIATSFFRPAKRTLRVGIVPEGDEFCSSGSVEYDGIDVGLARSIANLLGFDDVEFVAVDVRNAPILVDEGKIDIYVGPAVQGGIVFFKGQATALVRARDNPLYSVDDLEGKTIAVLQGSVIASWARRNLLASGLVSDVKEYGSVKDAVIDLRIGEVQALLIWLEAAEFLLEGQPLKNYLSIEVGPDRVVLAGPSIDASDLGRALDQLKSSNEWFDILNSALHMR